MRCTNLELFEGRVTLCFHSAELLTKSAQFGHKSGYNRTLVATARLSHEPPDSLHAAGLGLALLGDDSLAERDALVANVNASWTGKEPMHLLLTLPAKRASIDHFGPCVHNHHLTSTATMNAA